MASEDKKKHYVQVAEEPFRKGINYYFIEDDGRDKAVPIGEFLGVTGPKLQDVPVYRDNKGKIIPCTGEMSYTKPIAHFKNKNIYISSSPENREISCWGNIKKWNKLPGNTAEEKFSSTEEFAKTIRATIDVFTEELGGGKKSRKSRRKRPHTRRRRTARRKRT